MVVVIAGPTASGKSAVALDLAERIGGTIVNADASQLYADLRVLSARPSVVDEARVPHALYGVIDGIDTCSAARWAELACAALAASLAAGRMPIVTGGSGLYIRALLDGVAAIPPIDDTIRREVRALAPTAARAALAAADPEAAARLTDPQRVARALEVIHSTGRTLADWQSAPVSGLAAVADVRGFVVDRPRAELHARIDTRLDAMFTGGALDEVAALVARKLPTGAPVMKAHGVPHLAAALRGELTLAEAVERTRFDTRHYAKRQQTWFRNQTPAWTRLAKDSNVSSNIQDAFSDLVCQRLRSEFVSGA